MNLITRSKPDKKITLLVLIDAWRHDFLTSEKVPFVHRLAREGVSGLLVEPLTFQTRPVFLAGFYPDQSEVAHLFYYDPTGSPFWFLRMPLLGWLAGLPKVRRLSRELAGHAARFIEYRRGHLASALYASAYQVPFDFLPYFAFSEEYLPWQHEKDYVNVLDLLERADKSWLWLGYPTHDQHTQALVDSFKHEYQGQDFVFLHFAETDWNLHSHGPNSIKYSKSLRRIDEAIEEVFRILRQRAAIQGLVFGDHGGVEVRRHIDVHRLLAGLSWKAPRDFLYFLDSTQVRLWFSQPQAKKEILSQLQQVCGLRQLEAKELSQLHFKFRRCQFGEEIFVAQEGDYIFPNFFQDKIPNKGTHGYLPSVKNNQAAFVAFGENLKSAQSVKGNLVDVFPTLLKLLGMRGFSGRGKPLFNTISSNEV